MKANEASGGGPSSAAALAVAVALVPLLALGDLVTGADVSFTLLYAVAIGIGTWNGSVRWGIALSLTCTLASLGAELGSGSLVRPYGIGAVTQPHSAAVTAWNTAVQLVTFVALVLLLGALRRQLDHERAEARTDPLTAVANRRAFLEAVGLEQERARRHGHPLSLAYLDLDGFKPLNDRLGHAEGDAALVAVARTLRAGTRSFDVVARLGGDEFAVLLPETGTEDVSPLFARLRGELEAAMRYHGWAVGFSIGVVTWDSPPETVSEMIQRADAQMYGAKSDGKGTTRFEAIPTAAPTP